MTIIERIRSLCEERGETFASLERKMDFGNGTIRRWENAIPSADKLSKVADYFNVSVDYLLGRDRALSEATKKEKHLINGDEELTEYLELLRTRPECKMLFSLTKDATKADVEKAVAIIEALRKTGDK